MRGFAITGKRRKFGFCFALAIALLGANFSGVRDAFANDPLPSAFAELLREYRIPRQAVSIDVVELGETSDFPGTQFKLKVVEFGEIRDFPATQFKPILQVNTEIARNPASTIKLVTTLGALELLAPHYLWETSYFAHGKIVGDTLDGDLIMQGGGAPFITVGRFLEHVLALRQSGIRNITGRFIVDNSYFAKKRHSRKSFDGKPNRVYNIAADAALVNFSATRFLLTPQEVGKPVRVVLDPPLAGVRAESNIIAQDGKCYAGDSGWSYQVKREPRLRQVVVKFKGFYRASCGTFSVTRSILPNSEYTHRLFTALWRAMGGEIQNGELTHPFHMTGKTPHKAELVLVQESLPLADIITGTNKFSNNVMARHLLLTIAAQASGAPGKEEKGVAALQQWLEEQRIAMPKLEMENGSGLSRKARASAAGLSALLAHGWRSTYRPEFLSSLSLAALDGTMRSRLGEAVDLPIRGRARLKTGLLDQVRSMAGYVHGQSGRHYSVVLLLDSRAVTLHNGNKLQDALLHWVIQK